MIDFTWLWLLIPRFAAAGFGCNLATNGGISFLFFPTWFEFLPGVEDTNGLCAVRIVGINDVWLIVAAIVDILLRVVAIAAVSMMVYGGFQYVTSSGNPDQTRKAQSTIFNALIGLVIAVGASTIITFVAGKFS
jgi:hypothetical protein